MISLDEIVQAEFFPFLDRQIDALERAKELFDAFRAALIRRDMEELGQVRRRLEEEETVRLELDRQMGLCRRRLAAVLSCPPEEICISRLCRATDPSTAQELKKRQVRAQGLASEVKTVHLATELLLRECARINRRMLETITGRPTPPSIYDARGRAAWRPEAGLMNMKL